MEVLEHRLVCDVQFHLLEDDASQPLLFQRSCGAHQFHEHSPLVSAVEMRVKRYTQNYRNTGRKLYVCVCLFIRTCTYTHTLTVTHKKMFTCTHTHEYTHMFTYIHTHTHARRLSEEYQLRNAMNRDTAAHTKTQTLGFG